MMKRTLIALGTALLVNHGTPAKADFTNHLVYTVNQAIPDGDLSGLGLTTNLTGMSGTIAGVTLSVNILGGNNADLYAFLAGPNGGFAILLNRVGLGAANPYGYEDSGFNITLSDGAANIHNYQGAAYSLNGGGQLTGVWAPDGRNIDPLSPAGTFDSAAVTAAFSSFLGTDPNGVWTFYFADVSGGATSVLGSLELDIIMVPEPTLPALAVVGGLGLWLVRRCSRQAKMSSAHRSRAD